MIKKPEKLLYDVVSYGEKIEEYLEGISTADEYMEDEHNRLAIERWVG